MYTCYKYNLATSGICRQGGDKNSGQGNTGDHVGEEEQSDNDTDNFERSGGIGECCHRNTATCCYAKAKQ